MSVPHIRHIFFLFVKSHCPHLMLSNREGEEADLFEDCHTQFAGDHLQGAEQQQGQALHCMHHQQVATALRQHSGTGTGLCQQELPYTQRTGGEAVLGRT